jgi:AraC-like DNA-binding protein
VDARRLGSRTLGAFEVIVLHDGAVEELTPAQLAGIDASRVVIWPGQVLAKSLRPWIDAGCRCLADDDDVAEIVSARFAATASPTLLQAHEWWVGPLPTDPGAKEIFRAMDRILRAWNVGDLAEAIGVTRDQLGDMCKDVLGGTPREVLQQRFKAQAAHLRRLGWTWRAIAEVLGFRDEASIKHACARGSRKRGGKSAAWIAAKMATPHQSVQNEA